jgi:hypothetical protein
MGTHNRDKTHCHRGHEFTSDNTHVNPSGERVCRVCSNANSKRWRLNNPAKRKAIDLKPRIRENNPSSNRRRTLKYTHSITPVIYDALLSKQGGVCAICKQICKTGKRLAVDHDHLCCPSRRSCGKCIRGLICGNCNKGIGNLQDSPAVLRAAADYIEAHKKVTLELVA